MEQKSLEEHKEYLREAVKLSLWVAATWKNNHGQEDIIQIIHERTCLVSHTVFNLQSLYDEPVFEGNEWPKLRLKLKEIYDVNSTPENFEKEGFKLIEPYIYGRAERDLQGINTGIPSNNDSWIRYDLKSTEEYLEIHMENSRYPESFLSDEKYFYDKLKIAVLAAAKYGFKGLRTVSWLNDLPAWQKKMPKEWNDSIKERTWDIEWHLGFWGQFLTANQCFNYRLADKFRSEGHIPYPMSKAQVSMVVLKKHLGV